MTCWSPLGGRGHRGHCRTQHRAARDRCRRAPRRRARRCPRGRTRAPRRASRPPTPRAGRLAVARQAAGQAQVGRDLHPDQHRDQVGDRGGTRAHALHHEQRRRARPRRSRRRRRRPSRSAGSGPGGPRPAGAAAARAGRRPARRPRHPSYRSSMCTTVVPGSRRGDAGRQRRLARAAGAVEAHQPARAQGGRAGAGEVEDDPGAHVMPRRRSSASMSARSSSPTAGAARPARPG